MEPDAYLDAIRENAEHLAGAAEANLSARVPSCPGWAVADLVAHTGAVLRVWAYHIRERRQEPTREFPLEILAGVPGIEAWADAMRRGQAAEAPCSPELILWFREGARQLADALRAAGPEEPIWHWSGENRGIAHYQMMAYETAVHRWDAELARDVATPIPRPLAVAGIDHTFEVMVPFRRRIRKAPPGDGELYSFAATDTDEAWLLLFDPDLVLLPTDADEPVDIVVRGTASDLFLFLWQRIPVERLTVEGDANLLERYFELVPPI